MIENHVLTISEKQSASLDTLICFDKYCTDHQLTYFLTYGTLLGAVRHHGFIPWDDDVDVFVPRDDYEKLIREFSDPTGHFKLFSCFNDPIYVRPYAKLENMQTARLMPDGTVSDDGIGIDLFPLDGLPEDLEKAREIFKKQNDKYKDIINRCDIYRFLKPKSAADFFKRSVGRILFAVGYLKRTGRAISVNPYGTRYDDCKKLASVVGLDSGKFRVYEREWFLPMQMDFEKHQFTVPSGYDQVLKLIYGDYMQLPPEDQRVPKHSDRFIWRQ